MEISLLHFDNNWLTGKTKAGIQERIDDVLCLNRHATFLLAMIVLAECKILNFKLDCCDL